MEAPPLTEEELNEIYQWVDEIPLSRPKKIITRDFADGVLIAEIIKHYIPKLVDLHNYSNAHSVAQKTYNWNTLNYKVFRKMGFQISKTDIENVVHCVPDAVERVIKVVQIKLEQFLSGGGRQKKRRQKKKQRGFQQSSQQQIQQQMVQQGMQMQLNMDNEKDQTIQELRETIEILELKMNKYEQLLKVKENKIQILQQKLAEKQ